MLVVNIASASTKFRYAWIHDAFRPCSTGFLNWMSLSFALTCLTALLWGIGTKQTPLWSIYQISGVGNSAVRGILVPGCLNWLIWFFQVMKIKHFLLPPIFLTFFGAIEVNARCSRREFTICYPNGNKTCQKCPKCPAGHGLPIHCGFTVLNGTSTECIQCVANLTYSLTHDSSTCRPCRDPCGGKKMLTECTATQNRKCDSTCQDPNYYLNSDNECRECYFCCDTVSEGERLQQCKNIGMPRNKQCEKTTKNK